MTKRNKIIYWIATVWLSLGMLSTGIVQLIKMKAEAVMMAHLGYPLYFLTILGVWKILGVIAIVVPRFPIVMGVCRILLFHVWRSIFACRSWRFRDGVFRPFVADCVDNRIVVFQTFRSESFCRSVDNRNVNFQSDLTDFVDVIFFWNGKKC